MTEKDKQNVFDALTRTRLHLIDETCRVGDDSCIMYWASVAGFLIDAAARMTGYTREYVAQTFVESLEEAQREAEPVDLRSMN